LRNGEIATARSDDRSRDALGRPMVAEPRPCHLPRALSLGCCGGLQRAECL